MKVHIKPRLQQEKWSLYWKTSMSTRTFALDEFDLEVKHDETTAKEVKAKVAAFIGLPPVETLHRLEEFVEPWELMCVRTDATAKAKTRLRRWSRETMYNGRELDDGKTLAACGVPAEDGVSVIVVRKQLVAEGWKLRFEDNEDSDTEEDDF